MADKAWNAGCAMLQGAGPVEVMADKAWNAGCLNKQSGL